ncbi:MAG TPA: tRNA1(Val) (adenine(37)-N6)-methyltransferase [Bacillota bacterium]|nr:tRNA1(Val) (adenine(37)-N6)-methyltransferase [Bacillota bacterium]
MPEREIELMEGEGIDYLGYRGMRIIQNPKKFKFTMDAFLLTGFIEPKAQDRIVDLGCGGGVLPLLIVGKREVGSVLGLEIQPELVAMARRSVALNQLEGKIQIREGDIRELPADIKMNSFDYVVANPPFFPVAQGIPSANDALALARFEVACTLEDLIKAASRLTRGNGRFSLIYPAKRLPELLLTLSKYHFTPRKLRLIHPGQFKNANLLLLEASPGAQGSLEILPPLIVYDENGQYTPEMNQIYQK